MSLFRIGITIAILGYLAVAAFLYVMQRHMMYVPANKGLAPSSLGIESTESITLLTADHERLIAWYSKAKLGKPTILFFHGNAGEIGDRPLRLQFYQSKGFGVLYLSYRGYGGSTGSPSEKGLLIDAQTAYDWLIAQGVTYQKIVLVGESLGTGVAVQLAARIKIAAVALEAPYTSTADVAARSYWWLPVRLLMKDQFNSIRYIASINAPLFVAHGDSDRIIPIEFGRTLFKAALEPKKFLIILGGDHDAIFSEDVWQAEIDFFEETVEPQKTPAG